MTYPAETMREPNHLVWVDVETTGLDPEVDLLLEMSVIVTEGPDLVEIGNRRHYLFEVDYEDILMVADEDVIRMHEKSGLLADLMGETNRWERGEADRDVCQWLADLGVEPATAHLAGSKPSFDQGFLYADLPIFDGYLHHRLFDIRALITAADYWFREPLPTPARLHRSYSDIDEALTMARAFRAQVVQR